MKNSFHRKKLINVFASDKISSFRLVRSVRDPTIYSGNINDFRNILSTIFFYVRELLSSLSSTMFLFRAAERKKEKKLGFHGKLFHRLANTVSSSRLAGRFASPLAFFKPSTCQSAISAQTCRC